MREVLKLFSFLQVHYEADVIEELLKTFGKHVGKHNTHGLDFASFQNCFGEASWSVQTKSAPQIRTRKSYSPSLKLDSFGSQSIQFRMRQVIEFIRQFDPKLLFEEMDPKAQNKVDFVQFAKVLNSKGLSLGNRLCW